MTTGFNDDVTFKFNDAVCGCDCEFEPQEELGSSAILIIIIIIIIIINLIPRVYWELWELTIFLVLFIIAILMASEIKIRKIKWLMKLK